jgi:type I restriction enzyme S subunit
MKWETKSLGEVCVFEKQLGAWTLPYVGLEDIQSNTGKFVGTLSVEKVKSQTFRFNQSHVLYGRLRPYLNKVLLPDFEGHCSTEIFPLKPNRGIDRKYLFYWLSSDSTVAEINATCTGARMPRADMNKVRSLELPLPPIHEQRNIVLVLDEVFAAIENASEAAEKNLQNARELFETYRQGVFANPVEGWEETTLGDVVTFFNGFAFESADAVDSSNTQLVRMGNLYQNRLDLERKPAFYPDEFAINFQKFLIQEGDLIISLTGTTGKEDFGYTVQVPTTERTLLLNQRIAKIMIKNEKKMLKQFLMHYLLSRVFLDKLYKTANGTRQANLSTETMKSLPIFIPSPELQLSVATQLTTLSTRTNKLEAIYTRKLAALEELKKSILQQAFAGELTKNIAAVL